MEENLNNNHSLYIDGNVYRPDANYHSNTDIRINNDLQDNYQTQARFTGQAYNTNQASIFVDDTMNLDGHSDNNENIDLNVLPSNFEIIVDNSSSKN